MLLRGLLHISEVNSHRREISLHLERANNMWGFIIGAMWLLLSRQMVSLMLY